MDLVKVTAKFTPNKEFFDRLSKAGKIALEQDGEALRGDLVLAQTIPFDVGTLQGNTYADYSMSAEGIVKIVTQGPQARRLYFHPEYNFQQGKNPNAGGRWMDPYLNGGTKQDFLRNTHAVHMKKLLGV